MEEKQQQAQEKPQNSPQEPSQAISETNTAELAATPSTSRPRILSDAERVVDHKEKRSLLRDIRDGAQFRGSGSHEPLDAFASDTVGQSQQWRSTEQEAASSKTKKEIARIVEDREMVKWAAWGALLVSLVTSLLLGLYSSREFAPMFEYYDLEVTQKQIAEDVGHLKYSSQLEKIQNAITHAQVQLFVRKDYEAAEAILENAKEDLKLLIVALPIEKTVEPKQVLANIERVLADVRRGPTLLDQRLHKISQDLSKLKN